MSKKLLTFVFASALTLSLSALTACSDSDKGKTAGQKLDAALDRAQEKGAEAKVAAEKGIAEARVATDKAVKEAADATREPRAKAGEALADGAITAKIKAGLAQDSELSALHVSVETDKGRVELTGSAPSQSSIERATQMAKSVDGVTTVDNKLVVAPR